LTAHRAAGSYVQQVRDAVRSIAANISEAFGRRRGRDRDHRLEIARGEPEEALCHLKVNFQTNRIGRKDYWPRHNRLVVIVKMLNSLLNG
jgi:four helix bundle protein